MVKGRSGLTARGFLVGDSAEVVISKGGSWGPDPFLVGDCAEVGGHLKGGFLGTRPILSG